ncbi:MAG: tol-pal system YbgF family protein [Vampirovibrionia bacterium]
MSIIKRKRENNKYKISLLLSLILFITTQNIAFSQDKPLSTIGDPQINSPFTGDATPTQDTKSPFTSDTTIDEKANPLQQPDAGPQQPQIEELQGAQQPETQSMVVDPKNKLGLAYPFVELEKSKELLKKKDFTGARNVVVPLSEWLTNLTEYHIQLFKKLNGIDTAKNQAQVEKKLALDSALLRDKAYYQLALIYLGEKNEKEAIKYFVEVIKSQPKTELGMKSYEILQQIGFTEKIRLIR